MRILPEPHPKTFGALHREALSTHPEWTHRWPGFGSLEGALALAPHVEKTNIPRSQLTDLLTKVVADDAASQNLIKKLSDREALVVITGQQPGVFGGPLYSFLKAAQTVVLARVMEKRSGRPVIPIYWCLSDDHDVEEAATSYTLSGTDVVKKRAPLSAELKALEYVQVGPDLVSFVEEQLKVLRPTGPTEPWAPRLLEPVAAWSTRCLREVLGHPPLLVLEPRHLRPLMSEFWELVFSREPAISAAVIAGAEAHRSTGATVQVDPKSLTAPYAFLIEANGRRERVDAARVRPDPKAFAVAHHRALSPNVLLRPLFQQWALPIIAHVNGPGEIAYFGQLPELYKAVGLPLPVVIPRVQATVLRHGMEADIARTLGATSTALKPAEHWPKSEVVDPLAQPMADAAAEVDAAIGKVKALCTEANAADAGGVFEAKIKEALQRTFDRLRRVDEQGAQSETRLRKKLAAWIRPLDGAQERSFGPLVLSRGINPRILSALCNEEHLLEDVHHLLIFEEADEKGPKDGA